MHLSRWIKDPFCGLSHWFGAGLSVAGLVFLLLISKGPGWHAAVLALYGTSLIVLYVSSALAHSVKCSQRLEDRLTRLDYAAIFLLIAGTYTPVCTIAVGGAWGWGIVIGEWTLAAIGIPLVLLGRGTSNLARTILYLCMGWLGVFAAVPVLHALSMSGILWLLAGGAAYSIGAVIFVTDRPNLWPGRFHAHDLWHSLVLVGSVCHFILILSFVASAAHN
ncbi:MAG TPA: hemolysin III family protein [Humisphaera sp.]|nr:hemolysin III family protein [Humisphaera sp.]